MTNRELTIRGLKHKGWTEDENARTSKYVVFKKDGEERMFVGRNGALRYSAKGNVTDSISLTDKKLHKEIMQTGMSVSSLRQIMPLPSLADPFLEGIMNR